MSNTIIDENGPFPLVFKKFEPADVKFNPVQVNKTFTIYSSSFDSSNYSHVPLKAIYWSGNELPWVSGSTIIPGFDDIDKIVTNVNGSYAFNTYNSIYHSYYKYKTEPSKTLGLINPEKASRFLYQSASIFSIPQKKFGLRIKPTSFIFSGSSHAHLIWGVGSWGVDSYAGATVDVNLSCDKYENIFDSAIDTGSFPTDCKFYEGFNEYFDTSRITSYTSASGVTYPAGATTTTGYLLPIGLSAYFSGSGYLEKGREPNNTGLPGTYDRDNNYAISFYISSGSNSTTDNEIILAKRRSPVELASGVTVWTSATYAQYQNQWRYPFSIELSGSNQIEFSVGSGGPAPGHSATQITSSTYVSSSWTHVLCQKSGSSLQMYIDGTLHSSISSSLLLSSNEITSPLAANMHIHNNETLKIGGYNTTDQNLHGSLDEIRIYNKSLTSAEITTLADRSERGGFLQTNRVGNIFYDTGIIVVSSPDYRYNNIGVFGYTGSYQSTKNIYEFSSLCKIKKGDFNLTTNPSALQDDNETYLNYMTGSTAQPYFTTIGLYNNDAQLMATAKLATPLQKRTDIDMSILVRVDLDKPRPTRLLTFEEYFAGRGLLVDAIWHEGGDIYRELPA